MQTGLSEKEHIVAPAQVFRETYESYLQQIGEVDLAAVAEILGLEIEEDQARVDFFNRSYWIGSRGIHDKNAKIPDFSVCVVLCKYLLMCPHEIPDAHGLAAFKDFKDAAPLVHFFANSVQKEVARKFEGATGALEEACRRLGGEAYAADLAYQIKYRFQGLPRVPVYLLFNDAEEGFAAQCTLLFEKSVASFLDMESVAMLGGALVRRL